MVRSCAHVLHPPLPKTRAHSPQEILLLLGEALAGHHYSDGIQACGADITYIVQTSMFSVLRELVAFLDPTPAALRKEKGKERVREGEAPATPRADNLEGECRYLIVKLLMMTWRDYDFAFFRSVNLAVSLCCYYLPLLLFPSLPPSLPLCLPPEVANAWRWYSNQRKPRMRHHCDGEW